MEPIAIFLIVVSALMHAWWNLQFKQSPSLAFFFTAMGVGSLFLVPVLVYHLGDLHLIPTSVWCFLITSSGFQLLYFCGMVGAYRRGDMSLSYPLFRAMPVLLLPLYYIIVGEGNQIGWVALSGMVIIGAGCIIAPMKGFGDFKGTNYINSQMFFVLMAIIGTCGYSIIDDHTIRTLEKFAPIGLTKTGSSTVFWVLQSFISTSLMGICLSFSAGERLNLINILRGFDGQPVLAGLLLSLSYGLVLVSMPYTANVSYVIAFRQLSIPIGAMLGVIVLKESLHIPKFIALVSVFLGLVMVAMND